MKSVRTLVLLMLVVLLPLRGAVAATMLCSTPGQASEMMAALHDHRTHAEHVDHGMHADHAMHTDHGMHADHGMQTDHGMHAEHVDAAPPDPAGSHHDGNGGHADTCQLCAGGCQATPLATRPSEVLEPHLVAEIVFPTLSAAEPAFHSEGQERPPRSI